MARKTIKVSEVVEAGNIFLSFSEDAMTGERRGMAAMIERVLFDTHNYKGFRYLSSEWDADTEALREGHDDTRRQYIL